jgi:hypothetical protein
MGGMSDDTRENVVTVTEARQVYYGTASPTAPEAVGPAELQCRVPRRQQLKVEYLAQQKRLALLS